MKRQIRNYLILIFLIAVLIVPFFISGKWGNIFSIFSKPVDTPQQNQNTEIKITDVLADSFLSATLTYPNPYDVSKNDVFTLADGRVLISETDNSKSRGYNIGVTTVGDLNGDGFAEGVIGLYQGYGANRITPIIFVVNNENGKLNQLDYVLPDPSDWRDETQIKSVYINDSVLFVDLLILSEKEQNLPHFQQQPTVEKLLQYKLINNKLVLQQTNQDINWKLYEDKTRSFSFKYPASWTFQKMNCVVDFVAFCPLDGNSNSNCKQTCDVKSPASPIILYLYTGQPALPRGSENFKYWAEPNVSLNINDQNYKEIYTAIISTFKSTNLASQTVISGTESWKEYSFNGSVSLPKILNFKYPSDWSVELGLANSNAMSIIITSQNKLNQITYSSGGPTTKITCAGLETNKEMSGKFYCKTIEDIPYFIVYQDDSALDIYNKILSTFEFFYKYTDSPANRSADWKTYTNADYGFELSYPSNWKVTDTSSTIVGNNTKKTSINIESPMRYDLPGYQGIPTNYRILIYLDDNLQNISIANFGSPDLSEQSLWNVSISDDIRRTTGEYNMGQQIVSSFKLIRN